MGKLVQQGDSMLMSAELIDVRDNHRVWGGHYEFKLPDIQRLQNQISNEISSRVGSQGSSQNTKSLANHSTQSEAYSLYILGRYYRRQGTKEGWQKSIEYQEEVIKIDPNFAPAYLEMGLAYSNLGLRGFLPSNEAREKVTAAALKAVELDDTLSSAHALLGYARKTSWDWSGAEKEFNRALDLQHNGEDFTLLSVLYPAYLLDVGRPDEAVAFQKRVQDFDPVDDNNLGLLGFAYLGARQYEQALEKFQKAVERHPNNAQFHFFLGETYLYKRNFEQGIAEMEKAVALENAPERWDRQPMLAYAYAVAGRRDAALKILGEEKTLATQRYISAFNFAVIYTGLGDKDLALEWLQKSYNEHAQALDHLKMRPMFDSLHSDQRFTDLIRRMGLPT